MGLTSGPAPLQEYKKDCAKAVTYMTVVQVVLSPEEFKNNPQATHAKAMKFAASLGISRNDLPPPLLQKLNNWLATGDPELSPEAVKKAAKRKNSGDAAEPKKKRGKEPSLNDKKRKK